LKASRKRRVPQWWNKSVAQDIQVIHDEAADQHRKVPEKHVGGAYQDLEFIPEQNKTAYTQRNVLVAQDEAANDSMEVPIQNNAAMHLQVEVPAVLVQDRSQSPSLEPQSQQHPRPHWTWGEEAILDILRDHRTHNMRWPDIGVEMERSHMGCSNHYRDMCSRRSLGMPDLKPLNERSWSNGEDAQLIWLRSRGMSWEDIAQRHRRNSHSCHLRYLTLPRAEPPKASAIWQTTEKDLLWDLKNAGHSFQYIARFLPRRRITACEHMYSRLLRERGR
jgi:hypothetical protein